MSRVASVATVTVQCQLQNSLHSKNLFAMPAFERMKSKKLNDVKVEDHLFIVVWRLSPTLTLEYDVREYGPSFKFSRGRKFMALNENLWLCFRACVPKLRTLGYSYKFTGGKKVVVTDYQGMQYVSLQQQFTGDDGLTHTARININEPEWDAFIDQLHKFDRKIAPVGVKKCPMCSSTKQLLKTRKHVHEPIDDDERKEVIAWNLQIENQLGIRCEDCGHNVYGECHCHEFDCRQCNDQLFCPSCGDNKFMYLG